MMGDNPPSKKKFWFFSVFWRFSFLFSFFCVFKSQKNPSSFFILVSFSALCLLFTGPHNTFTLPPLAIYTFKKIVEQPLCTLYKPVSYTHLRAHETVLDLVCRLL